MEAPTEVTSTEASVKASTKDPIETSTEDFVAINSLPLNVSRMLSQELSRKLSWR